MKSTLLRVALVASALMAGQSVAFAGSAAVPQGASGAATKAVPADPFANAATDRADYLKAITALCPDCSKALVAVGADYKKKCGFEPTVAQYRAIGQDSPEFSFRLAITTINNGDVNGWTPKEHAQYDKFIEQVDCKKL